MSHFATNGIPFVTRVSHGAKHILARDQARAQKLLAGLHPHGPAAFHARHSVEHAKDGHLSATAGTVPPAGDPTASSESIDVTDAGS
jgi:hypothetical protein